VYAKVDAAEPDCKRAKHAGNVYEVTDRRSEIFGQVAADKREEGCAGRMPTRERVARHFYKHLFRALNFKELLETVD